MSCFRALMGTQDWPQTHRLDSGPQNSRKTEKGGVTTATLQKKKKKGKKTKRGERGDAEAVPQAARRQLAQRCARPIFSFPHAHLTLKQLLKHSHTQKDFSILISADNYPAPQES